MTNRLNELGKQLSTVSGKKFDVYNGLKTIAIDIIKKHLDDFPTAEVARSNINSYAMGKTEMFFEIAFQTGNGYDFSSDFTLTYEERYNRLFINYGTAGRFTCDDFYQCERIRVLNNIIANRLSIEMELQELCTKMDEFITLQNQAWEIENEIQSIKKKLSAMEVEAIERGLTEGTVYKYTENAGRYHYMLPAKGRWFTLVKITPKKVRLHIYGDHIETTYLVDKSQFVYQIKNGVISEVNN